MFISEEIRTLTQKAEAMCADMHARIDRDARIHGERVLDAFREMRVSEAMFAGTTGYGYGDRGRDTLDKVFALALGTEDALVRAGFINGTHAISTALFAALRPGDCLLSLTGKLYDTLEGVLAGQPGCLADYGVSHEIMPFPYDLDAGCIAIEKRAGALRPKACYIQRSRGYSDRPALSLSDTKRLIAAARRGDPNTVVIIDNCYCEFVGEGDFTGVGADLICGSLIKNPGGSLAPSGGYIAGTEEWVQLAAGRYGVPGIGREAGATGDVLRLLYQGLFFAPTVTAAALKTAVTAAALFELMGYECSPRYDERRADIITSVRLGSEAAIRAFCEGIQAGAPVDSFVTPEPWDMPGYASKVIMAAGAFVSGASIELSADAPMREPYTVYFQGGVTFETARVGIMSAAQKLLELKINDSHYVHTR